MVKDFEGVVVSVGKGNRLVDEECGYRSGWGSRSWGL